MSEHAWLPELLPWDGDEEGNPSAPYLDLIYSAYERDFGEADDPPMFRGLLVHPKRQPLVNGRCGTFWHVTSQTMGDGIRVIRPRRCERIQWIRPMIEAASDGENRVVSYPIEHEHNEIRWEIALTDFSYLVVVAARAGHYLLWAAFEQEKEQRRRKAQKKYDAWVRAGMDFDAWLNAQKS